jgi:NAD(P)-dependent dehydrogenase (short-subunit alcohol dehydrogenase family)
MNPFKDKIAIVTGGASGIGKAISKELGSRGTFVIVTDINDVGAHHVAIEICSSGGKATSACLDVTDIEGVDKFINETAVEYGRLDYIFNNAGMNICGEARDMDFDHWKKIIDINLWSVIAGSTSAYKIMVRQGFGHIVNTASIVGLVPLPTEAAYATTKSGVIGLSSVLRAEGAAFNVKVSMICPGLIDTGIFEAATVLEMNKNEQIDKMPRFKVSAEKAAKKIIDGVARNKEFIVFPFSSRLGWWLRRLNPSFFKPLYWIMLKSFREMRINS